MGSRLLYFSCACGHGVWNYEQEVIRLFRGEGEKSDKFVRFPEGTSMSTVCGCPENDGDECSEERHRRSEHKTQNTKLLAAA